MKNLTKRLSGTLCAMLLAQSAFADLTHRYSFDSDITDSIGGANGSLAGAAYIAGGVAVLDGTSGTYVDLPGGLLEAYTAVTIETWSTVYPASAAWTRLFDFGNTNGNNGANYLFVTTQSGNGDTRVAISDADPGYNNEEILLTPGVKDDGTPFHLAVVWAPEVPLGVLYVDGTPVAWRSDLTIPLSAIATNYCFIGRSLYAPDGYLNADIDEFRIHNTALTTPEIAASVLAGPDTPSYDPGAATSLALTLPTETTTGFTETPAVTVTFATAGTVTMPALEISFSSDNTAVLDVNADGSIRAVGPGTATITAAYNGQSDTATMNVLPPTLPPASLVNRWSFNEAEGNFEFVDSVGSQVAVAYPAAQGTNDVAVGNGQIEFFGGASYLDGAYVDLPDYLLSSRQNLTMEFWVTWRGAAGSSWQRIIDAGSSSKGEDPHASGNGQGSFFITPRNGANGRLRFDAAPEGFTGEQVLDGPAALTIGQEAHIVAIFAPDLRKSELWHNGVLVATGGAPFALSSLNDINCWIGLANWNDPPFFGSINEFRVYEGVLNELEVALSRQAGPNTLSTQPGNLVSLEVSAPTLYAGNTVGARAALLGNFQNASGIDVSGLSGSTFSSSDETVFTVTNDGLVIPQGLGTATLTGTYEGQQATASVEVVLPPNHEPATLVHRYSFSEAAGSVSVADSVGGANGTLMNASVTSDFTGDGRLNLAGGAWDAVPPGAYVNLPNGLVSSLTSMTIETWFNWAGPAGSAWQRVFDIGRNSAFDVDGNFIEDQFANPGVSYTYLSPRSGSNTLRFAIKEGEGAESPVLDAAPITPGTDVCVTVVYDTAAGAARLYLNGQRVASGPITLPLSVIEDLNVYLGRSNWTDTFFAGQFDEFRIYTGTMLDDEVLASFNAGPDAGNSTSPSISASVNGSQLTISWSQDTTGFVLESAASADAGSWTAVDGVANNQVTVEMTGSAAFYRLRQQ